MIRSGPVPLEGDSKEKGEYTGRHLPWGFTGESHIECLNHRVLCRRDEHSWLVVRTTRTERMAVRRLDPTSEDPV